MTDVVTTGGGEFVLAVSDARDRLERAQECIEFAQRFKSLSSENADRLERAYQSVIDADGWLHDIATAAGGAA